MTTPLNTHDKEKARQALAALRGYAYQIYHTVSAWIDLEEQESLHIEVAEDFAKIAEKSLSLEATQIKDVEDDISLGSHHDVVKVLNGIWRLRKANPELDCRLIYLTTGSIRRERDIEFPDKKPGIQYWRECSAQKGDVDPIRQALLLHVKSLDDDLALFIANSTSDQLRSEIITRITWSCERESIDELRSEVETKLVYHGNNFGIPPRDSVDVFPVLAHAVLCRAILTNAKDRILSKADYLKTFEGVSLVAIPASAVRQIMGKTILDAALLDVVAESLDIKSGYQDNLVICDVFTRDALVEQTSAALRRQGIIWITGSIGSGKSRLADAVTRNVGKGALRLNHRHNQRDLHSKMNFLISSLSRYEVSGVVIDEITKVDIRDAMVQLKSLLHKVKATGLWAIIVSTEILPPELKGKEISELRVPMLSETEVSLAVKMHGGDPSLWTKFILLSSSGGNPSLAAARIIGLKSKGWPNEERLNDLLPNHTDNEAEAVRGIFRSSICLNYPAGCLPLIGSLIVAGGYFDKEMASEIAPNGSFVFFDLLLGPIIERRSDRFYALSSIVGNKHSDWGCDETTAASIRLKLIRNILKRRSIQIDLLPQLLLYSFATQDRYGLMAISQMVITAPGRHRRALCESLSLLAYIKTDNDDAILPGDVHISSMLRLAQFKVASAIGSEQLNKIAAKTIIEARRAPVKDIQAPALIAATTILFDGNLYLPPSEWIRLILMLRNDRISVASSQLFSEITLCVNGLYADDVAFISRVGMLRGSTDLLGFVMTMNTLNAKDREHYLGCLKTNGPQGHRLAFQSGWFRDAETKPFPSEEIVANYRKIIDIVMGWGSDDIVAECHNAVVVVYSEYCNDSERAMTYIMSLPPNINSGIIIQRQLVRIMYRDKNYINAAAIAAVVFSRIDDNDWVEKGFLLREWVVSLVEMGKDLDAEALLANNIKVLADNKRSAPHFVCGMHIELALLRGRLGLYSKAAESLACAARLFEQFSDPRTYEELYRIRIFVNVASFLNDTGDRSLVIPCGASSNPDPTKKILDLPLVGTLFHWYHLLYMEIKYNVDLGARIIVDRMSAHEVYPIFESMVWGEAVRKSVCNGDVYQWKENIIYDFSAKAYIAGNRQAISERIKAGISGLLLVARPTFVGYGTDNFDQHADFLKDSFVALCFGVICRNRYTELKNLYRATDLGILLPTIKKLLDAFDDKIDAKDGDIFQVCVYCLGLASRETVMDADELYRLHCYMTLWISRSAYKNDIVPIFENWSVIEWRLVISQQKFLFFMPRTIESDFDAMLEKYTDKFLRLNAIAVLLQRRLQRKLSPDMYDMFARALMSQK